MTTDDEAALRIAYESARHVGIPSEQIDRWLGTMRMCGFVVERQRERAEPDNYVAWCRYIDQPNATRIALCDSDSPGAFKVYRTAPPAPEPDEQGMVMVPIWLPEVVDELMRAVKKFPTWPTDPLHAVAVLGEEFGELTKATLQLTYEPHKSSMKEFRTEALQTAAMALRFVRSLDAYQFTQCAQHEQDAALSGKGGA